MTFGEIVDHAHERAGSLLKEKLDGRKAEGFKVYVEPAMRNASGTAVLAPDGLKLPLRFDLAFRDSAGEIKTEYADSSALNFREPVFAEWEHQLKIEIHSICWAHLSFRILPTGSLNDCESIRRWFFHWFDEKDENTPNAKGLNGVVHFISDPLTGKDGVTFWVDFGSAPPEALGAFFDVLIKLGAKTCCIGKP